MFSKEIKDLLNAGANVELPSVTSLSMEFENFARLAKNKNANFTITEAETIISSEREKIAKAGGNNVTFRFKKA